MVSPTLFPTPIHGYDEHLCALHAGNYRLKIIDENKWLFLSYPKSFSKESWLPIKEPKLTCLRLQTQQLSSQGTAHSFSAPYTGLSNDELALGSDRHIESGLWKEMPLCGRPRKPRPLISVFSQHFLLDHVGTSSNKSFQVWIYTVMSRRWVVIGKHTSLSIFLLYMMSILDDESDPGNRCWHKSN